MFSAAVLFVMSGCLIVGEVLVIVHIVCEVCSQQNEAADFDTAFCCDSVVLLGSFLEDCSRFRTYTQSSFSMQMMGLFLNSKSL
jgi:hypothetical protein|mmetsp:Transcript_45273/g.76327  ORF Transcript_45273/g.76327 Transcript_45273/m.76327 type:complete len:84 (+) Transcript_45273:1699-1950(+)